MEVVIEVGRPHEEEEEEEEESAAVGSIKCNWVQQGKRGGGGWMAGRQSDTYVIVGEYMSPVGAGGRHSFNNS